MGRSDPKLREAIARKFREWRGSETLAHFLQRHGLGATKWNRYENAKETPSLEKLIEIFQTVDISPTWLLLDRGRRKLSEIRQDNVSVQELVDQIVQEFPLSERITTRQMKAAAYRIIGEHEKETAKAADVQADYGAKARGGPAKPAPHPDGKNIGRDKTHKS